MKRGIGPPGCTSKLVATGASRASIEAQSRSSIGNGFLRSLRRLGGFLLHALLLALLELERLGDELHFLGVARLLAAACRARAGLAAEVGDERVRQHLPEERLDVPPRAAIRRLFLDPRDFLRAA